jgi:methyltransferase
VSFHASLWPAVILGVVTVQRIGELIHARHNTEQLLAKGAYEVGADHYPLLVAMHAAWLIGLWVFAIDRPVNLIWLGIFIACQVLRAWVLVALGDRWTTRVIVVPNETLIAKGPYRFFSHPNYVAVVIEIFALPMTFGLVWFALLFSFLNAVMLWFRLRVERRALKIGGAHLEG